MSDRRELADARLRQDGVEQTPPLDVPVAERLGPLDDPPQELELLGEERGIEQIEERAAERLGVGGVLRVRQRLGGGGRRQLGDRLVALLLELSGEPFGVDRRGDEVLRGEEAWRHLVDRSQCVGDGLGREIAGVDMERAQPHVLPGVAVDAADQSVDLDVDVLRRLADRARHRVDDGRIHRDIAEVLQLVAPEDRHHVVVEPAMGEPVGGGVEQHVELGLVQPADQLDPPHPVAKEQEGDRGIGAPLLEHGLVLEEEGVGPNGEGHLLRLVEQASERADELRHHLDANLVVRAVKRPSPGRAGKQSERRRELSLDRDHER